MKEIQEILKKIKTLQPHEKAILATVVDVQGSSYRLPGARMLVLENGDTFGTVSGGCLEANVLERAKQVLETGEPQIFTYDTTNDQDSVFSLNMGCRGIIRILLEPIRDNNLLEFIQDCFREKKNGLSATLISSEYNSKIGSRMLLDKNKIVHSDFDEEIKNIITKDDGEIFASKKSQLKNYEFGEIFFDCISLPVNMLIFGAGADAVPLAEIAKSLGWFVKVVDHREKFANKERFAGADEIIISRPEEAAGNIEIEENSVAVVMTHNYDYDKHILKFLLKSKAKYVGSLGPKRRAENILREFAEEGFELSENEINKLYAPVGLDIGADTPEAIALSIAAEIQAVLHQHDGGFLRNRQGSIYGRN